ncbi:MAG: hypothetical protein KBF92_09890 [Bacteroidia bacterium]|nr:hypothetical protein [Bacteroidia bacterium]
MSYILSTTSIDSQGDQLSLEDLEYMAKVINGPTALRYGLEHDPTYPPLGQLYNARTSVNEEGIYLLLADVLFYKATEFLIHGEEELVLLSTESPRPFKEVRKIPIESIEITTDITNISNDVGVESYLASIKLIDENIVLKNKVRKAAINDPEVIITLAKYFALYKIFTPVIAKLSEKIVEDLSGELYEQYFKLKQLVYASVKAISGSNNKYTVIIQIPFEKFEVELVYRPSKDGIESFIESLHPDTIKSICEDAQKFHEIYDAEKIQFVLNSSVNWRFNYLLSSDGKVIGNKDAIRQRDEVYSKLLKYDTSGHSFTAKGSLRHESTDDTTNKSD